MFETFTDYIQGGQNYRNTVKSNYHIHYYNKNTVIPTKQHHIAVGRNLLTNIYKKIG